MASHIAINMLASRSDSDSKHSNTTCAYPLPGEHGEKLPIGITFKWLMKLITLTALALTTASALFLITKHLHRYTVPREQRQIIRIIFLPVFMCIISLLSIFFYVDSIYIKPISEVYQAFCIAAIFLLFLEYVCPDASMRPKYFHDLPNIDKKKNVIPGGSLLWYNRTYAMVLQYPLTKTLTCIVEIATQAGGVFCTNSLSPKYAHIWLMLLDIFVIGGAVSAVFRFYGRLKPEFDPKHHALAKLVAFKGMVIFQFFQDIIFGLLNGKFFKPSAQYTYDDIYYGIPAMMTALEAMIFCFGFHFAYRSREYHETERAGVKKMPLWRAVLDALNLSDIVFGIFTAIKILVLKNSQKGRGFNFNWEGGNFGAPKRQRTKELNDMAFEPLNERTSARTPSPPAQAHHEYDNVHSYGPPAYGPPVGLQEMGVSRNLGVNDGRQQRQFQGYDEYRETLLSADQSRSRDPSPNRPAQSPRELV